MARMPATANMNVNWMNTDQWWPIYIILIVGVRLMLYFLLASFDDKWQWTLTNVIHCVVGARARGPLFLVRWLAVDLRRRRGRRWRTGHRDGCWGWMVAPRALSSALGVPAAVTQPPYSSSRGGFYSARGAMQCAATAVIGVCSSTAAAAPVLGFSAAWAGAPGLGLLCCAPVLYYPAALGVTSLLRHTISASSAE